jgi:hypothetical protein
MLRDVLRAIVVLFSGGWGIGACFLGLMAIKYANDGLDGARWAKETALGVGLFLVGILLLAFAWWMLYPPAPRRPADDAEMKGRRAPRSPVALLCILGLAALIIVAVLGWLPRLP